MNLTIRFDFVLKNKFCTKIHIRDSVILYTQITFEFNLESIKDNYNYQCNDIL